MNFGHAIGIIPALPKFVNAQDSNPPSPRPSPLIRVQHLSSLRMGTDALFSPSPPAPLPLRGRGV